MGKVVVFHSLTLLKLVIKVGWQNLNFKKATYVINGT